MNKSYLRSCILTACLAPLAISAQTAEKTTEPKADSGIELITVTALRKTESLQDVAVPIDAATGKELSRIGVTDATGLNKISPALNVVSGGGSNTVFFVRGVGNFAVNAYTDAALAFNVDGVFLGRPTATTASFLDVERIEVLKGPQGTLYGRNATAGAINVISTKPELGETFGNISIGAANYGTITASGAVNLPISDDWAARFAIGKTKNDGYNDDGTAATDDTAFRARLFGEFSEDVNLTVTADYSTTKGNGNSPSFEGSYGFPLQGSNNHPKNIPGYNFNPAPDNVSAPHTGPGTPAAVEYYTGQITSPAFTSITPLYDPYIDNEYMGVSAELNVATSLGDLTIIPAYRENTVDVLFNNPAFQAAINQENHQQSSLEARFSTTVGALDLIMGGFYFDEKVDGLASFNQYSLQSTQDIENSSTKSTAFFVHGKYHISDDLRLVGAVRWTKDKKEFKGQADVFLNLCIRDLPAYPGGPEIPNCDGAPVIPVGATVEETIASIDPTDLPEGAPIANRGPVPYGQIPLFPGAPDNLRANLLFINQTQIDRVQENDEITYRAAIEYDIADSNLLYTSYETGYRSGGFSPTAGREEFLPEYINAWTFGSKNRFLDNYLQINAEAFIWDYEDQQASHFGIDGNGNSAFFTENIGQSSIKGVEVDILYQLTEATRIKGNIQYLKNEIEEFSYLQKTPDEAVNVVTGCDTTVISMTDGEPTYNVNCSGKEGRNSPSLSLTASINHYLEFNNGYSASVSFDARYRDERWVGFDFLPSQRAEDVITLDTSMQLFSANDKWSILAYVRNITDEEIKATSQLFANGGNTMVSTYEKPRTYGITFKYDFY
ncbi:TonB-dependent receptor [Pseudoalteromonas sp. SG43-4]|uniref:TonB-dependent receptor n=1 Tax=Pseudoalteromonas sp. SG43-4 TaxID=2760969 RepID=UPI0015FEE159|nr:TonB-dependent receptor [Pseudoalteromonas sp. SG43-4]MBB1431197.1 TonB-dependent receptor [Pseudoalteromonas sp. SG43-4]